MLEIIFSNQNFLYLLIPFFALLIIIFVLSIRHRKIDFKIITSFVLHVFIIICLVFSASDMKISQAYTANKAEIVVLADLSFSSKDSIEQIDESILSIDKDLDDKTTMCVVGFGKNYELITPMGQRFVTVANNTVDNSATDIANALNYADTLFSEDAIKKIIVISDGKETDGDCVLVSEQLIRKNVHLDVINFNATNNVLDDVLISGVSCSKNVFKSNNEEVAISIRSSFAGNVNLTIYQNETIYLTSPIRVNEGINVYRYSLNTSTIGENFYRVTIESNQDSIKENNERFFIQNVVDEINVLILGGKTNNNYQFFNQVYTENTKLTCYDFNNPISLNLESLCRFDEIILDNFNLDDIPNPNKFVSDLDTFVSLYGKSIMTYGDLPISVKYEEAYKKLEKILPVRFRPSDDSRVVVLVIDCSLSMAEDNRLQKAKEGAIKCLDSLDENDYVMIESFCQNVKIVQPITRVANKDKIIESINTIEIDYGTHIGFALNETYNQMQNLDFDSKRVVLLSDGEPTEGDMDPIEVVKAMSEAGVFTSVLNISCTAGENLMKEIAVTGNGSYYFVLSAEDIGDIMASEIQDEYLDKEIEGLALVNIDDRDNALFNLVDSLPSVAGYYYSRAKGSAKTIVSTNYINEAGGQRKCPIFATWKYGRGNVSTFTSRLDTGWANGWKDNTDSRTMIKNIVKTMCPNTKTYTSLSVDVENNGYTSTIRVGVIDIIDNSILEVTIVSPSGARETKQLVMSKTLYVGSFNTIESGKYEMIIRYGNIDETYEIRDYITFSYSSEYDTFDNRSAVLLYKMVGESGKVYEKGETIEPIIFETYTSTKGLSIYLLVSALVLFILDIVIRKSNITQRRKRYGQRT